MTNKAFQKLLSRFDYAYPKELVAQKPASPRDSARLLVYDRKEKSIAFDTFKNLGQYLPQKSVLVFNQSRVLPARLKMVKQSGGKVEVLYLGQQKECVQALLNKKLQSGTRLFLKHHGFTFMRKEGRYSLLKTDFPISQMQSLLLKYGKTPLPPYIKHSPLTEKQKREEYQTVFASKGLSAAAPTAGLHFSESLLSSLKKRGIEIVFVRLDVGLGTFAPLTPDNLAHKSLHEEYYEISPAMASFLNQAKKERRKIIPVGTTAARTLESSVYRGRLKKLSGHTRLFIAENDKLNFVDGLITNFHVPKSSLLMLVSAFTGSKQLRRLYKVAVENKLRLFSFGDGMLII